jgi:agmatinase
MGALDRITTLTDSELTWELAAGEPWQRLCARLLRALPKNVWVTFDIDGLEPALCPNTGTPVPGGLRWREVMQMFHELGERGHSVIGFDLCEVGDGHWDAVVGARLLYKLAGWSIATKR